MTAVGPQVMRFRMLSEGGLTVFTDSLDDNSLIPMRERE